MEDKVKIYEVWFSNGYYVDIFEDEVLPVIEAMTLKSVFIGKKAIVNGLNALYVRPTDRTAQVVLANTDRNPSANSTAAEDIATTKPNPKVEDKFLETRQELDRMKTIAGGTTVVPLKNK